MINYNFLKEISVISIINYFFVTKPSKLDHSNICKTLRCPTTKVENNII